MEVSLELKELYILTICMINDGNDDDIDDDGGDDDDDDDSNGRPKSNSPLICCSWVA